MSVNYPLFNYNNNQVLGRVVDVCVLDVLIRGPQSQSIMF